MEGMRSETDAGGGTGNGALHPIGVVARRTGISLHVLRAWERRYGVVEPMRTEGGQRLYTDADIVRLRLLRRVTEAGRNISQVAQLTEQELARLATEDAPLESAGPPSSDDVVAYREACLGAARRLDADALHATLMRAVVSLRPGEFLDDVLLPLLREVGEEWHAGRLSPAQEHVVSATARRVVTWLVDAYESADSAPLVLVTTVAGEEHEFGALMVSVIALDEGWRVSYLGTSLPAAEIIRAAQMVDASLVALSVVNRGADDAAVAEVSSVRVALPATVPVVVGGAGAVARRASLIEAGAEVLEDSAELREALRRQRAMARESVR
jgi:MerR family transcriptional regulator, light-induced transcriptional regulator